MEIDYQSKISTVVNNIAPSAIRRFFDLANEMKEEVISLSIGEPDFVTPWSIREAGIFSLEDGYTHYSPNQGYIEVRKAISEYLERRFDLKYDPKKQLLVTVGGSEALDLIARALINPGDEVIILEPCFVAYKATVTLAHGVPVVIETKEEDEYKLKPEALEAAITDKTKYIILGYPGNPTGATMTKEDLSKIKDVLVRHPDIFVVSDELYSELSYTGEKPASIANFPELYDRTIVVNGFSKSFAMTGWRIGYMAGPAPLIAAMNKVHQYCIMSSPTTAQYAVIEACRNGDKDVEEMRDEYNRRRRVIINGLKEAGLSCFDPTGAFYAFPSIEGLGLTCEEFCERFLMEKKVAIVPGSAFGKCGEGHVRISYAASMENIQEAMRRLKEFVTELKNGSKE
ncbi:MAG: aminotransferase class I/II-fold pyridoxal phosphate-dependent enzyme [Clostridiales bacterium]|nr:aminotransferase class I/II-fold pyridoxal phosphate-dependent enzyme [Clostridiales bacterium]MBR6255104.1 aminotransferase class I/II-fold pyridoxal phosphate-dependent enzyme [Clostridiales bacterium]